MASATSTALRPSNWSSSWATPWPGIANADGVKPCTFCQSTTCTGPRRPSRRWAADGDPGHHPVAGPGLFDAQVGDHHVGAGQLRQFGIVDLDRGVEDLAHRQNLAGPLLEVAQRHVAGVERHRVGLDRGDPQNRDEDFASGRQIDDQPQDARLLADDADADHDVADAPKFSPSGPSTNIRESRATYTLLTESKPWGRA